MNAVYEKSVIVNAIVVFHQLVDEYINHACLFSRPSDNNRSSDNLLDRLNNASVIEEETIEAVKKAISKTLDVMRDVELMKNGNMEGYVRRRKVMSEIPSILHIGSAYPQSANNRLNKLIGKI